MIKVPQHTEVRSLAEAQDLLKNNRFRWLVTGAAGFIGSNLVEALLALGQDVVGLDNFATGHRRNLREVEAATAPERWPSFQFMEADIRNIEACRAACAGVDFVLHQAAVGSVPRSIADPITTNEANVSGFLNMLVAARDARVRRFIFAASSSTYGNHPALPRVEDQIGRPLSPYAVSKLINELYADVFSRVYGMECIGLRYFNVFGPRQDPHGAYAAVIPLWFASMMHGEQIFINGDGETSRDFCFVDNVVQANLLAALVQAPAAVNQIYNIAVGQRTTLNELFGLIQGLLSDTHPEVRGARPVYREFRTADVRHSLADVSKAQRLLGYVPAFDVRRGLEISASWYRRLSGA